MLVDLWYSMPQNTCSDDSGLYVRFVAVEVTFESCCYCPVG